MRHALPNITVQFVTYPKFETRGDLKECVSRFREWYRTSANQFLPTSFELMEFIRLQNKVIDIEVENSTPSPTVDPSVHVILIGHSMGGIVGAETLLLLASERPLPPLSTSKDGVATSAESNSFMFPHVQGLMAFDTPFLGIAPGVMSHGAQEHYKTASTAYNTLNEMAGIFGYGAGNKSANTTTTLSSTAVSTSGSSGKLPLPPATTDVTADAAATPSWSRWGKMAMFAGAAGAVAAGGAAALYSQRERVTEGWRWVTSHLEFIGCLVRPGDLRKRMASLAEIQQERGIKAINFYTCLGQGAAAATPRPAEPINPGSASRTQSSSSSSSSLFLRIPRARDRTFCHLPEDFDANDRVLAGDGTPDHPGLRWVLALNDKAVDETTAHISMFCPRDNPKYYMLAHEAADVVVRWIDQGWYASATGTEIPKMGTNADMNDEGPGADMEADVEVRSGEEDIRKDQGGAKGRDDKDDFIVI